MAKDVVSRRNHRGQSKTLGITVYDTAGDPAQATTLTADVIDPGGTVTTYTHGTDGTWTNPATGSYTFTFTPDTGSDAYPWEVWVLASDGTADRVGHAIIWVEKDRFEDA